MGIKVVSASVNLNVIACKNLLLPWEQKMYGRVCRTLLQGKYIAKMGIKVVSECKKCSCMQKFTAPMGIEDVLASVQNIFPCKCISPTGIEIVSVVAQIIPAGKNLPHRLQIQEYLCPCMVVKPGDRFLQIYIHKNTTI